MQTLTFKVLLFYIYSVSLWYYPQQQETVMATITNRQVKSIASEISKRFQIRDMGGWYNITDKKTGQMSGNGGDYNFAGYNFKNAIQDLYLAEIKQSGLYLSYQVVGVEAAKSRMDYIFKIECEVVRLLCGFVRGSRPVANVVC